MKRTRHFVLCLLILILAITVGCGKEELKILKPNIDFTLEDENGNPIKLSDQTGKIRLVTFLFTTCTTTCPATTHLMKKTQDKLMEKGMWGDDIHFYTVTFDPERDTGEVMKAYAEKWGMDVNHWSLVRGSVEATRAAAKDFGILVQQVEDDFIHSDLAALIDQKGQIRKYYTGSKLDPDEVIKDMKSLQ